MHVATAQAAQWEGILELNPLPTITNILKTMTMMVIGGGKKVVYLVIKVFSGWYCVDGTFRNVFRSCLSVTEY